MKKLLAMVLALVMTLSLAVSANAAFKDADKVSADYSEAVAVLNGMGVFKGYEDGSFQPQGNITRAEVAAIVYRVYTADVKDAKASMYATYNKFSDMTGAGWAAGYIGYCANAALVKGYPNGTFQPSGKVTGYEVLAMILRAIGYDQNNEFTGADWALHVAQTAQQAGVLKNVKGVDLNAPATRELVAELLFRAIAKAPMVTYTAAFGYQTVSFSGSKNDSKLFKDNETLGHKNFDLTPNAINGTYGRPATKWTYNVGDTKTTVYDKPVATYTEKVAPCDVCKDLSEKKEATFVEQWIDGVKVVDSAKKAVSETYKATDTSKKIGAQGQLTEVYANGDDYTVVYINTYLAKVTKVIDEVKDKNDHVKVEASVNVDVYGTETDKNGDVTVKVLKGETFDTDGFKKNDMVLVTYDNGDIASMEAATGKVAKLTSVDKTAGKKENITDVQDILGVGYEKATVAVKATFNPLADGKTADAKIALGSAYTFYYDAYGNIIGVGDYTADANYVVVDAIYSEGTKGVYDVYANLIPADDATKTLEDVKISAIEDQYKNKDEDNVLPHSRLEENDDFYHNLMTYTVDEKGNYELYETGIRVAANNGTGASYLCSYDPDNTRNGNTIYVVDQSHTGRNDKIFMDKDTTILFQYSDSPNGTFKNYTLADLPAFVGYVEYVVGSDGIADVVYIIGAAQSDSYVFIPNVNAVTTSIDKETGNYVLTLNGALVLEDGKLVTPEKDLTVSANSKNMVIDRLDRGNDISGMKLTALTEAGLYKLWTVGDNSSYLAYADFGQVQSLGEYSGKTVVGYAGKSIDVDALGDAYTVWEGDFAGTHKYSDSTDYPYASKLTKQDKANDELSVGDYVFVQWDKDYKNIVAVYKAQFAVDVDFDAASKTLDKDAKITAPTMYYGQSLKDFTVAVSKWVKLDSVTNGTDTDDYSVVAPVDADKAPLANDVARTFTAKAADSETVKGNIVVSLADDSNTAIGKLDSVTLDREKVQTATGYTTLAQALENATTMNSAAVNPQYKLVVNTKAVSESNATPLYGNVKWASDKEAAADLKFDAPAAISGTEITLEGAGEGTYVVILLENYGDVAYYAYRIAD